MIHLGRIPSYEFGRNEYCAVLQYRLLRPNSRVSRLVHDNVKLIREGQSLSHALDDTGLIPAMVVEMVKVGEATGALTDMLANVADYYDEEIEADLDKIVALVEPVLLIVMGIGMEVEVVQ